MTDILRSNKFLVDSLLSQITPELIEVRSRHLCKSSNSGIGDGSSSRISWADDLELENESILNLSSKHRSNISNKNFDSVSSIIPDVVLILESSTVPLAPAGNSSNMVKSVENLVKNNSNTRFLDSNKFDFPPLDSSKDVPLPDPVINTKKTWVSLFTDNRKPGSGFSLNYVKPDVANSVTFDEDEWNEGSTIWKLFVGKFALVMKQNFAGGRLEYRDGFLKKLPKKTVKLVNTGATGMSILNADTTDVHVVHIQEDVAQSKKNEAITHNDIVQQFVKDDANIFLKNNSVLHSQSKGKEILQVIKKSDQHATCLVKSLDGRLDCVISTIYGFNQMEARKELWSDLNSILQNIGNIPWLLCGNFNTMISNKKKLGGTNLTEADTREFRKSIEDCSLNHLKTQGCFYTWNNKQDASTRVWSRLDKAPVNDAWINMFNSSHVEFLLPSFSDHSPTIVLVYDDQIQGKKPFKFFKMWTKHDRFLPTVSNIWESKIQGFIMFLVYTKLKLLRGALKDLNKKHFKNISGQVQRAIIALEDAQRTLQSNPLNPALISHEKECFSIYNNLLDYELSFYKQKARISWSVHGDRCTSFFMQLLNQTGMITEWWFSTIMRGIGLLMVMKLLELVSFYKNLIGTAVYSSPPDINIIKSGSCLNDSQIRELSIPVTKDETKAAVFSMADDKAPGPDSYSASFFKTA
ncbi:uncharacterized protein LOC109846694 [Asparagus officinalis]|uniref:uncharacterized protein LOC109846694 n=1 Tax=Asparagus officinalis TaxID=4686 RepID=UPI00098E351E|nr:uncharacterized protein LOC109846694 [Asparagus officinalis]